MKPNSSNENMQQTDKKVILPPISLHQKIVSTIFSSKSSSRSQSKQEGVKVNETLRKTLKTRNQATQIANQNLLQLIRLTIRQHVCEMCQVSAQLQNMASIGGCSHNYCFNCLQQYGIYKIQINEEVLCPQGNCKAKMDVNSQLFYRLPKEMQERFKKNQLWRQTLQNPNLKLCPSEKCKQGLIEMLKSPPTCNKCKKQYCKQCMMTHHQGPCDANFQLQFSQWKRCPSCKIFIHKTIGCNHMTCHCKHEFCYQCLAKWHNSHYACIGLGGVNERLFYEGEQQINKCKAFFLLIAAIIGFPFFILLLVICLLIGILIAAIAGVLCSPCYLCAKLSDCCGCCCCFPILLPLVMIAGAIVLPGAFIYFVFVPNASTVFHQYCHSMQFFKQQLTA